MGEGNRVKEMGLGARVMRPGEPIKVDLKNAVPEICECGCKFFIPVVALFTVSALLSPTGQELTAQQPVLVCMECKRVVGG